MSSARPRSLVCCVFVAGALGALTTTGCGGKSVLDAGLAKPQAVAEVDRNSPAAPSQDAAANLILTPVDRPAFDAAIAKLKGKVVLIDFWATWCLPCVEQLPHTLELGRRFADRGLVIVTVCCDDPADANLVDKFLASQQAKHATNLISHFGGSPKSMEAFEITTGSVPYYKLYDRSGKLQQTFGINPTAKKQYMPADIDAAIEDLLNK